MKKALSSVLAILLALAMLGMFAACGGGDKETTVADTTVETTTEPESEDVVATTAPEGDTSDATETTVDDAVTEPGATTVETTTEAADVDPTKMNKDQLVKYYNDAINLVRSGKPGYTKSEVLKIDSVKTSVLGGMVDGIVNGIVNDKMPGTPNVSSKNKGENNVDHFMNPETTSAIRVSDVSSITATKSGDSYVITLNLGTATNPAKNGGSAYSRLVFISSSQDVLDELSGSGVQGDPKNCVLSYRGGKSVITVNAKGQITKAHSEFFVDADAKSVKVSIISGDIVAYQSSKWDYTNFVW